MFLSGGVDEVIQFVGIEHRTIGLRKRRQGGKQNERFGSRAVVLETSLLAHGRTLLLERGALELNSFQLIRNIGCEKGAGHAQQDCQRDKSHGCISLVAGTRVSSQAARASRNAISRAKPPWTGRLRP